jgi:hypothetical protein
MLRMILTAPFHSTLLTGGTAIPVTSHRAPRRGNAAPA